MRFSKRGDEVDLVSFRIRKEGATSDGLWRAFTRSSEVSTLGTARGLCRMRVAGASERSVGPGPVRGNTTAEQNFSGIARCADSSGVSVVFDSRDPGCELESLPSDGMAIAGAYYRRLREPGRRPTPANRVTGNESEAVWTAFRPYGRSAWSPGGAARRMRIHDRREW